MTTSRGRCSCECNINEIFKVYAASTIDLICSVHSSAVVSVLSCIRTYVCSVCDFRIITNFCIRETG